MGEENAIRSWTSMASGATAALYRRNEIIFDFLEFLGVRAPATRSLVYYQRTRQGTRYQYCIRFVYLLYVQYFICPYNLVP